MDFYDKRTGAKQDSNRRNYINHVALVLDGSTSMRHLSSTLIKVADDLVKHLARKSVELDQETRVTVYTFADETECVIFDKDVLRLPSIAELYQPNGNTALRDATGLSIQDLRQTMAKYGDHAFLTYVLTDGEENRSYKTTQSMFTATLENLRDNETVAVLVPNDLGVRYARSVGFPEGNIAKWEVSAEGLEEAGTKITRSADSFMESRVLGIKSTKGVFTTDLSAVNKSTVNSKKLTPLPRTDYVLLDVKNNADNYAIREWVEAQLDEEGNPRDYVIGKAFYQLTKTETVQTTKGVALQNIHSGRIYTGQQARDVLNLPDQDARVRPASNDEYRIYIQSTSVNRKLVPGTKLLLLK